MELPNQTNVAILQYDAKQYIYENKNEEQKWKRHQGKYMSLGWIECCAMMMKYISLIG